MIEPTPSKRPKLFRAEAIESRRGRGLQAELVVLDQGATNWGFRLLCLGMTAIVVFLVLGRLNEYASGPAFVQVDGRLDLTASEAGLVTEVTVKPGDQVVAGEVLVRFDASEEGAQLRAAHREFESQLAKLLVKPDDRVAREALVSLRSQRDLAKQRLERRALLAPRAGVVGDVRVRVGQLVQPGHQVLDLRGPAVTASVTALLPGRYRPLLQPGDKVRFELDGFHRLTHELSVLRVGEHIVGPREAARFIGPDLADAFSLTGPVVLVEARLPETVFTMDGEHFSYSSGMMGKAEAIVRNEPIAFMILPSLKQWGARAQRSLWDLPSAVSTFGQQLFSSVRATVIEGEHRWAER